MIDPGITMFKQTSRLIWAVVCVTVSVIPGWLLTIAKSLHCMATAVINSFKFNYDGARRFGQSVNLLRNFIDITWAMFVSVCDFHQDCWYNQAFHGLVVNAAVSDTFRILLNINVQTTCSVFAAGCPIELDAYIYGREHRMQLDFRQHRIVPGMAFAAVGSGCCDLENEFYGAGRGCCKL